MVAVLTCAYVQVDRIGQSPERAAAWLGERW